MKRLMLPLSVLMIVFSALATQAQVVTKIGYADVEYIFSNMPDAANIENTLKATQAQLQTQIDAKSAELQKKYKEYVENSKTMLDAVRANTERELQQLNDNLQKFQQEAELTLQKKRAELMEPVQKKIGKAIEDVAKENGFAFILNPRIANFDILLFTDEKQDISDLVLKKLGITPKPQAAKQ